MSGVHRVSGALVLFALVCGAGSALAACPKPGADCSLGGQTSTCYDGCDKYTYVCSPDCPTCSRSWHGGKSGTASAGTACGTNCVGVCDDAGVCDDSTPWPVGKSCGSGKVSACTGADTCNDAGLCETHDQPDGTKCSGGSCVGGECVNPDAGAGGAAGSAGAAGAGATGGSGGASGGAGGASGSSSGSGGASAAGGGAGTAGAPAAGGAADDGGCGCRSAGSSGLSRGLAAFLALLAFGITRTRKRR